MSSESSLVAAILSKLPFVKLDVNKKLSFAEFLKLMGLEFDDTTKTYRMKINSLEGSLDELGKQINELSANGYLILISEITNKFIEWETVWDKIQSKQPKEPNISNANDTRDLRSEVDELQGENILLQKKGSQLITENAELIKKNTDITQMYTELDGKRRELERRYTELNENNMELSDENTYLNNLVAELKQKITNTKSDTPPKPTSEKKAHRVVLIETPEKYKYKFVRAQEENLRKSLESHAIKRQMHVDAFRNSDYVKIWPVAPHAIDTVDNLMKFLKQHNYNAAKMEVTWTQSRSKLERIVDVFLNGGAGGREAAKEILETNDA